MYFSVSVTLLSNTDFVCLASCSGCLCVLLLCLAFNFFVCFVILGEGSFGMGRFWIYFILFFFLSVQLYLYRVAPLCPLNLWPGNGREILYVPAFPELYIFFLPLQCAWSSWGAAKRTHCSILI